MNYMKLGVGALGLACIVAGALLPTVQYILLPTGVGLLTWLVPTTVLEKKEEK